MKKIAILGSTGNVGTQTLDIIDKYPDKFQIIALSAAKTSGTMPAAMNAANDFMVEQFLNHRCEYLDIQKIIKKVMDSHKSKNNPSLEDIKSAIKEARETAKKNLEEK